MRITPLDIRKQEFRKVVRGMDTDEVRAFLATVADEYEAVLVDNKQLRERILDLDEKVQEYRTMEKTLRDTLMTAERVLTEAKENAAKEAELILRDAQLKADTHEEDLKRQSTDLRRDIMDLNREKEAYLARFLALAEAQIRFIEDHKTDFEELDRRLMSHAQNVGQDNSRLSMKTSSAVPPVEPPAVSQPAVQTVPESAPVQSPTSRSEHDEWRDYDPGTDAKVAQERSAAAEHGPAAADPPAAVVDEALAEAAVVDEVVETITRYEAEAENETAEDESNVVAVEQANPIGPYAENQSDTDQTEEELESVSVAHTAPAEGERDDERDQDSFTKGLGEM